MKKKLIDARGLDCPAPVLQTKNMVERENPNIIKVIVDNEAARQNVSRFLESRNFDVSVELGGEDFSITGKRGELKIISEVPVSERTSTVEKKIMIMVATDRIGHGDDELGLKLMVSFLTTIKEMGPELWRLVFVNNGVKFTIAGSEVLPILKELEEGGVHILVCGTCLNHFDLFDKKRVGEATNMLDIVTAMQLADKVINI